MEKAPKVGDLINYKNKKYIIKGIKPEGIVIIRRETPIKLEGQVIQPKDIQYNAKTSH